MINVNVIDIFEEIRFIVELLLAEQLLAWSFAKKRPNHGRRSCAGFLFMVILGMSYAWTSPYILNWSIEVGFGRNIACVWYIGLALVSLAYLKLCYEITWSDLLFFGICGYTVQHIEYVAVNEVLARGIWTELQDNLPLYIFICIFTCALWFWLVAYVFSKNLKACGGLIYEDRFTTILYFLAMLVVVYISSFMCQSIFVNRSESFDNVNYLGAASDFFTCTLILVAQYSVCRISSLNREKEIVKQLLYERQKQYQLSKENIEIINHKCHDLKHQIQALKQADAKDLDQYIEEVEDSIMIYDHVVETENEVLNTILSEKSLYCEKHQITLTCIADGAPLDFMSTMDIYALLGNALDNAIEAVSKYKDVEKRVISLTILAKDSFLCIQTNNYCNEELQFKDGLPLSTKKRNRAYHGFGMKSMKHLTQKYGGTLVSSQKNDIFMLQIVLPIPKEFMRLWKKEKEGRK